MKLLGLVTLLSFLITLSILSTGVSSSVAETIFYNGTVIIRTYNQSVVYLPLQNITRLQASSHFILQNNKVFLANPDSVLSYQAKINGVIKISQPYNSSICIILPYQTQLLYLYPAPISSTITQSGFLNLTFYGSNITIVFSPSASTLKYNQNANGLFTILVVLLIISVTSTITLAYLLLKNFRKEKVQENLDSVEVEIDSNNLDERDKIVLEAIRQGADTLAKISKITGLPRTTAYRRVKKLISLGYVEEIRERNKIRYVANKNVGENDNNI